MEKVDWAEESILMVMAIFGAVFGRSTAFSMMVLCEEEFMSIGMALWPMYLSIRLMYAVFDGHLRL